MNYMRCFLCLLSALATCLHGYETSRFPPILDELIQTQQSLPRYVEAKYSPLGRSPVVDAVLGDPFYLPNYAKAVSKQLKISTQSDSLYNVYTTMLRAAGVPVPASKPALQEVSDIPSAFCQAFGQDMGSKLYTWWFNFMQIYREVEEIFAVLTPEEKLWIKEHHETFFFGTAGTDTYDFFTTDSKMPLKFFEFASRIDFVKLSVCAQRLTLIVDAVYQQRDTLAAMPLAQKFEWTEQNLTFVVSGRGDDLHTENVDFMLELGGNDTYLNNAGGTLGERAVALLIDLEGNDTYIGKTFTQGCGCLGIGILADFGGNDIYKSTTYSQGVGFFGIGMLVDMEGDDRYELNFFGQSAAAFGQSLLWDKQGNDIYLAHEGMAQAASSTLGVAFLIDNSGNDTFTAGSDSKGLSRTAGIGQGGSTGVRSDPWPGHPSFYGGLSFLYKQTGNDIYRTHWLGQGSAYFLGAGILVDEAGDDQYYADVDAQGQGLHLAAGLLLDEAGNDLYKGGWGSTGVAADRSVGMLIDLTGDDIYEGNNHSVGSARKPKALGVLIDLQGNDHYSFGTTSNGTVQWPINPEEWPTALFLDMGGVDTFPETIDGIHRGNGLEWGIPHHAYGIDMKVSPEGLADALFAKFPAQPRLPFAFSPLQNWPGNVAYRSLTPPENACAFKTLLQEALTANYDRRRQIYESLDLTRFIHPERPFDVSDLLQQPVQAPEDLLNYAFLWGLQDKNYHHADTVADALDNGEIASSYARKMAIRFINATQQTTYAPLLAKLLREDADEENRVTAALGLAKMNTPHTLQWLEPALHSSSERLRYAAARGLLDTTLLGALEAIQPLLSDPSFYVRRAAAMTAISLHDKHAIQVLLDTLDIETLDTGENYGDNLYSALAPYVGVDFGVDRNKWHQWWAQVKDTFVFPEK